jgi:NADH pyrophosphatase NudC (nudix superfamily)
MPAHLHLDVRFLAVADGSKPLRRQAEEVADLRWFTLEEALRQADDASLRRLLLKARAYLTPAEPAPSSKPG